MDRWNQSYRLDYIYVRILNFAVASPMSLPSAQRLEGSCNRFAKHPQRQYLASNLEVIELRRCSVDNRPSFELIKSLRTTLLKLEESFASPEDQPQIAELKRILLLRIADIEFVEAIVERDNADEANSIMALALV